MLNRFSLKFKVYSSFITMISLIALISIYATYNFSTLASEFFTYREMAMDSNLSSEVQSNMLMVRMNVKDFIISSSEKDIKQFNEYFDVTTKKMDQALVDIQKTNRATILQATSQNLKEYQNHFNEVVGLMKERNRLVTEKLNINGKLMEEKLSRILFTARRDRDMVAAYNAGIAMRNLLLARLYVTRFFDTNDRDSVNKVVHELREFEKDISVLEKNLQNSERRKLLRQILAIEKSYSSDFQKLVTIINKRNNIITEKLDVLGPRIASNIEEVKLDIKSVQDKFGPRLKDHLTEAKTVIVIISIIALITGIALAVFFVSYLSKIIAIINEGIQNSSKDLNSVSNSLNDSANKLSSANQQQSAALQETSSSIHEISCMVANNTQNAQETASLSEESKNFANEGKDSVNTVRNRMDDIQSNNEELVKNIENSNREIEGLIDVINRIAEKTTVINDIVFQTKLLSFNASVEAARAGEHGDGFAVVAHEVGQLAAMSGEAAEEISQLLSGSITQVRSTVDKSKEMILRSVEKGKISVDEGVKAAQECEVILNDILNSFDNVNQSVKQISSSSTEQSQGVNEITSAVTQLSQSANENSIVTQEAYNKAQEVNSLASRLHELSQLTVKLIEGEGKIIPGKIKQVIDEDILAESERVSEVFSKSEAA